MVLSIPVLVGQASHLGFISQIHILRLVHGPVTCSRNCVRSWSKMGVPGTYPTWTESEPLAVGPRNLPF